MNWSGGYKNRFRSRQEHLVHKSTFQQQRKITLIDNVAGEFQNLTPRISDSNNNVRNRSSSTSIRSERSEIEPNVEMSSMAVETSTPVSLYKHLQGLEPNAKKNLIKASADPFADIPQGSSSSDSDDSTDVISSTNYSPPNSVDSPFTPKREHDLFYISSSDSDSEIPTNYLNQRDHNTDLREEPDLDHQECLLFSTPIMEKKTAFSSDTEILNSSPSLESSASIVNDNIFQTPVNQQHTNGSAGIGHHSLTPHPSQRGDILPSVPFKRVRFLEDDEFINRKNEEKTVDSIEEIFDVPVGEKDEPEMANDLKKAEEQMDIDITSSKSSNYEIIRSVPSKKKSTSKKASSKIRKHHIPCHCRTIVRKVKVRDVETQTSD